MVVVEAVPEERAADRKVNSRNEWESFVEQFKLPKHCVNSGVGLKQIYIRSEYMGKSKYNCSEETKQHEVYYDNYRYDIVAIKDNKYAQTLVSSQEKQECQIKRVKFWVQLWKWKASAPRGFLRIVRSCIFHGAVASLHSNSRVSDVRDTQDVESLGRTASPPLSGFPRYARVALLAAHPSHPTGHPPPPPPVARPAVVQPRRDRASSETTSCFNEPLRPFRGRRANTQFFHVPHACTQREI
ncbi:AT-rich interactive domain-containing protein 2 [Gryllus bimaculatus]|nr:AT-rich interactive domain-containing protein 2 [Gryllus bimaculatus]